MIFKTLAMEGVFSFFLESVFLGIFIHEPVTLATMEGSRRVPEGQLARRRPSSLPRLPHHVGPRDDLHRRADGVSRNVSAGNSIFVLLGFPGMYSLLGILLLSREIEHGPEPVREGAR